MIERFEAYELRATLAANLSILEFEIQLEQDAPFILRGWGVYGGSGSGASDGGSTNMRFTAPDGRWIERIPSLQEFSGGSGGSLSEDSQIGVFAPVQPQLVYAPGSVISFQFVNIGFALVKATPAIRVVMFGSREYCEGQVWAPALPPNFRALPFDYNVPVTFTAAVQTITNQIFHVQADAGFLWCGGDVELNDQAGHTLGDVGIRIRDDLGKYYMNDYIYAGFLFNPQRADRRAFIYPAIYVPPEENLFVDFQRNDVTPAFSVSGTATLTFKGYKIYPRR